MTLSGILLSLDPLLAIVLIVLLISAVDSTPNFLTEID